MKKIIIIVGAGVVLCVAVAQNFAGDLAIAKPEVFSSLLLTGDDFDA